MRNRKRLRKVPSGRIQPNFTDVRIVIVSFSKLPFSRSAEFGTNPPDCIAKGNLFHGTNPSKGEML